MNLVLTGFMGTGKTAVGRRVAERLHAAFHDVDTAIVERAGMPISRLFAEQGEPVFRRLETQVIEDFAAQDGWVISTGGGALLVARNCDLLRRKGLLE
jgi:shikimate kinase